ncbi:MAG: hypothetical protein K8T20_21020 [Planctomycetes bacterium]|nr:hypothetical protein [Planctomycetota bacterium]
MQMYAAPPPPPPRRRGFPFILTGFLLAFATVCALTVAGAVAFAFLAVHVSAPSHVPSQTSDLFLLHMAAGRYAEASRLVAPEYAGAVAALGKGQKESWGESQGCRRMNTHADVNFDNGEFREELRSTLEYSVKGTDGKLRVIGFRVVNGAIVGLAIDGTPEIGEFSVPAHGKYREGGCRIEPIPAPVRTAPAESGPAESDADATSREH